MQGVGFRPFAFRHALALGLVGEIHNDARGACLELEGEPAALDALVRILREAGPPISVVELDRQRLEPVGETALRIVESDSRGDRRLSTAPDRRICPACLVDLCDPANRRYRYAFVTCTDCGPRTSILLDLPFDRARTTMAAFPLCAECAAEFDDPSQRRFRAETLSCPACGPRLVLRDPTGAPLAEGEQALRDAAATLQAGKVLGVKGIGGFQLLGLAREPKAVAEIRRQKQRPDRPLAVLFSSRGALLEACEASEVEVEAVEGALGAIVLLRTGDAVLQAAVAPGMGRVGVMLPTSPLHALLLDEVGAPLVCTSANRRGEPLPTLLAEALGEGAPVAAAWLDHDRAIAAPVDDPVLRFDGGVRQVLRRARGDALQLPVAGDGPAVLALGSDLKNTVALVCGSDALVSPHIGDLRSALARERCLAWAEELLRLAGVRPEIVAGELHPDSAARRLAEDLAARFGCGFVPVQHHHAHVAAVMAEQGLEGPVLGLAWDGYGAGEDGGAWGGEALVCGQGRAQRVATLVPFPLLGLDRAAREPRRCALGLLVAAGLDSGLVAGLFSGAELSVLSAAARQTRLSPPTSSVGRLFDGVAALLGVRALCTFEGQAAMELEAVAEGEGEPWEIPLLPGTPIRADWRPMVQALVEDRRMGVPVSTLSARFHASLAALVCCIASEVGLPRIILSGGCFQNARLVGLARGRLESAGFPVYLPHRLPANDGGISLGQAMVVRHQVR